MAVEVFRWLDYGDGLLTVDLTFDRDDGENDPDLVWWRVECHSPTPLYVAIYRGSSRQVWRDATLNDADVLEGGPQGPVRKLLNLNGFEIRMV